MENTMANACGVWQRKWSGAPGDQSAQRKLQILAKLQGPVELGTNHTVCLQGTRSRSNSYIFTLEEPLVGLEEWI